MDIRQTVLDRMIYMRRPKALKPLPHTYLGAAVTPADVAKLANVAERTTYNFLVDGKSINLQSLGKIMDALGLEIVVKEGEYDGRNKLPTK
jgi:hypothetical protein